MTPDQKTALKQALDQHSFRMSVKDAAPEDVAQLPDDFQVPSYSANTSPLYENQLFPKITSADDLINLGYATPEGVPTESGQMAIALKKAGALNDDYTLNDTGKAMMASREDLLKEENLPLYMKSKELDLDDAGELSWGEVGSNFLNELKKGGKNLIDLAGYDTSSMTPQEKASFDLQSQAAVGGLVKAGAILPMGFSQIVGNATIKAISDNESEENLGLALLNQKFEKQSDEINNAKTAEVVDAMGQMFGAELGMEEARQQNIQTVGAERAQELESGGESAGGVAAMFTPGGPSMLTAKVAFGVGAKGLGAAFKPISRSLLQADAKAAMVLDKTKQLASLQRQAGALQLTTQAAERQAAIGESMAQKFSQAGFTDRANNALRLANQARTKGQEAAVRLGGFADEIATISDDLAKATQSATVADKVLQITQKAGQIPYLPITALGKTLEYTGRGMIGIDKGLSNLASKIGADKAYNAMNKITTLSGLGGVGAASGLGPAAFIPAAIKTAWSTAPYIKATGEYVGLMGKEAMKARGQIGFWKRMYEMPNKGPMHRAVSGLMDTATAGGRVTGAAGRVGKGLVASYPVDLAFEWVAEGGEMNPNVLKQAAVETLVFGGTGAALGGITMGSAEKIRSLQNGDATNFYRSIADPSQRVMFNGMAPDLKRAIGTFSASNPGAKIEFVTQGEGAYDRNTKTVMVNPTSRNPLKPLLTHEFMHHMLNNGIGDGVVAQLVGDGYQTGGILRSKDGGYEPQYEAFKDEYVNRLRQQHERNIKLRDAIGDPVLKSEREFKVPDEKYLAEEYFIETNVDDMLGLVESGKLGKMAGRMVINDKVRALGDAILNKSAILRDLHFRIGGVMDKQGKMVKGNGFLGGQLYQSPEIRRMFNKMVNESVGRRGGVDAAKMKARNGIELPITGKTDPILGEMSSLWESDVDGNPLTDKNGDYIPLSKQTDELRSQAGMLLIDDMRARQARGEVIEDGELAYNPDNNTWSGQYLTDRQIDLLALSGRFNNKQIKQLKLMNQAARATSDPNADPAARGHRFSVIYQPALKKNRKGQWRYDQIKPQLRDVVPYGVEISKDGNILIRIMSTNQLFANVSEKATTKRGRSLYNGDMDSILRDANAVIDLHGKNQATDAYFKEKYGAQWSSHKEFINSVFGNVGKGHKDINPLVASDRVDAVVKSYRLDRMNKATQLVGATQLPYQNNLIKINYLPEGEPILDANGEPKDLRYTPRAEDRMPEQRQMPEQATPVKRFTDQLTETPLGETFKVEVDGPLFRSVTQKDWDRIQEQGYLDSDQRYAVSKKEGVNMASSPQSAITYAPIGDNSVLLKINPSNVKLHGYAGDQYIRTWDRIKLEDIEDVGKFIGGETLPSYMSQGRVTETARQMPEVSPEDLNPVANKQEAQGLWADGKQMFALNEMDEKLTPITSKAMLDSYSSDAIGWMEPEAQAGQMRFMPESEKATPAEVLQELDSTNFIPRKMAAKILGPFPEYLTPVADFIAKQREKLVSGTITPRDVWKAYAMTVASQGTGAVSVDLLRDKLAKVGIDFNPTDLFTDTGKSGQRTIRPEEAAAYWLGTPEGKRALDNAESGNTSPSDWDGLVQVRKAYGDDRFKTFNVFSDKNLSKVPVVVDQLNQSKGNSKKVLDAVQLLNGVSTGKKGFISHLLGLGNTPTIDAVEINFWLTGKGDVGTLKTKEADLARKIKDTFSDKRVREEMFNRVDNSINLLRDVAEGGKKVPKDVWSHVMHHWLWDKAKGLETTHAGMYEAQMRFMPDGDVGENSRYATPPSEETARDAISTSKRPFWGKHRNLEDGEKIGVRIDIPAFLSKGVYVQTVHEPATPGNVGDRIGYDTHVRLKNGIKFFVKEGSAESKLGAVAIKEGRANKHPIATVEGSYSKDRTIPKDINSWTAVGMNPDKHSYFYDKRTDEPVVGGDESYSVGNTVFVKNPVYGNKSDFRFMPEPLPANYQSSRDTTFLYQSIGPDGIVNLSRPIKSTEALPTVSTRHEYPVEDFTVSKFDKRASILYTTNKNGEPVTFKFDPQLMNKPEFADFDDLYDGAVVQLAMADRHGATDGDMGGHGFPDLKVNQDFIVDDGNGKEYKLVWSNNAWGPVKNMSTKAQKYGATTLLTYNMDPHAHDSNTRTVRIFSNEIANSGLSLVDQSTLLIVMNVALKKAQSSASKQDLRAFLKDKKDIVESLKKDDKIKAKSSSGNAGLSVAERDALLLSLDDIQKQIDDENKFLNESLGVKLAGDEEVKVDALFRNYQNKRRAYEKAPTSEAKKKAMVDAEKELKKYQKTKEFKKAEGLLPSRELDKFSNTFKGRKSLILAVKNKEASVKWHGFDSQKISQAIGDQLTGDSLHIVSSVELSQDPNFKAVYLGDDPREIARMSPQEKQAAQQLKSNPDFVPHEAYLWSMLGPAESKHTYNTNQRSVLESFPDFVNEYSQLPVKPGKLKLNDPNSKASEFNIVNTIRDQSKIKIVFRAETGRND